MIKYNLPSDFVALGQPVHINVNSDNTLQALPTIKAAQSQTIEYSTDGIDLTYLREPSEIKAEVFQFNYDFDSVQLNNELMTALYRFQGLFLVAPQVGINYRVIAALGMDSCMFNPTIIKWSHEKVELEEGDLNFPGITPRVKRAASITVRYLNAFGKLKVQEFTGLTARIVQQAIERLDGKTFVDGVSKLKLKRMVAKANKGKS